MRALAVTRKGSASRAQAKAEAEAAGFTPAGPYPSATGRPWPLRCVTCNLVHERATLNKIRRGYRCDHPYGQPGDLVPLAAVQQREPSSEEGRQPEPTPEPEAGEGRMALSDEAEGQRETSASTPLPDWVWSRRKAEEEAAQAAPPPDAPPPLPDFPKAEPSPYARRREGVPPEVLVARARRVRIEPVEAPPRNVKQRWLGMCMVCGQVRVCVPGTIRTMKKPLCKHSRMPSQLMGRGDAAERLINRWGYTGVGVFSGHPQEGWLIECEVCHKKRFVKLAWFMNGESMQCCVGPEPRPFPPLGGEG